VGVEKVVEELIITDAADLVAFRRRSVSLRTGRVVYSRTFEAIGCMICIDFMTLVDSCQVDESGRIGERSTHAWFVLKYLLGYPDVQSDNCSWTK